MALPTLKEYKNAYDNWYCVTAKNPVSFGRYVTVMSRIPKDIKQINDWIAEGRKPS